MNKKIIALSILFIVISCRHCQITNKAAITGCWEKTIKKEQYIFSIRLSEDGGYGGNVITLRDGKRVDEMQLADVSFTGMQLSMLTNPRQNIVFRGKLDTTNQSIAGNLHFKNGSTFPFTLLRYAGQECGVWKAAEPAKLSRYKSIVMLPVMEMVIKKEINFNYSAKQKYTSTVSKEDAVACIKRWHGEIYPNYLQRSSALMMSFLLDPVTTDITGSLKKVLHTCASTDEKISAINRWTIENMAYTQVDPMFSELPGKDPWGTFPNSMQPVFKKLIPAEMKAMKFHTGKISGKCFTLVNLVLSGFIQLGVDPNDMLVLIKKSGQGRHAMALVKYEDELLLVNFMMVDKLSKHIQQDFGTYEIMGIYNALFSTSTALEITHTDLKIISAQSLSKPLSESVVDYFYLEGDANEFAFLNDLQFTDRNALYQNIFNRSEYHPVFELTKYAYQSLKVEHPEYYLDASLLSSLPKELAQSFRTADEVFSWLKLHIRYGSIYEDSEERLMTADQVLVFQQGSYKDQAVLACTLLRHFGVVAQIKITEDNAYIYFMDKLYDIKNAGIVESPVGKVILELE